MIKLNLFILSIFLCLPLLAQERLELTNPIFIEEMLNRKTPMDCNSSFIGLLNNQERKYDFQLRTYPYFCWSVRSSCGREVLLHKNWYVANGDKWVKLLSVDQIKCENPQYFFNADQN